MICHFKGNIELLSFSLEPAYLEGGGEGEGEQKTQDVTCLVFQSWIFILLIWANMCWLSRWLISRTVLWLQCWETLISQPIL